MSFAIPINQKVDVDNNPYVQSEQQVHIYKQTVDRNL